MSSGKHLLQGAPGKKPGQQLPQEHRLPSPSPRQPRAQGPSSAQNSSQQVPETQEWVCEPLESRRRPRHWSLSIEERRQRALQAAPRASTHNPDIVQVVAQLVSEDVDRDVLILNPPRSAESTHAFQAFLCRSSPFWQNMTSGAGASRWPPS